MKTIIQLSLVILGIATIAASSYSLTIKPGVPAEQQSAIAEHAVQVQEALKLVNGKRPGKPT
jgi:hypothetical protein